MNELQAALADGQAALFTAAGESIAFRGAPVVCSVNLTPAPRGDEPGSIDFTGREVSEIEIRSSSVTSAPKAGEFFTVGAKRHQIETVSPLGSSYVCRCFVTS